MQKTAKDCSRYDGRGVDRTGSSPSRWDDHDGHRLSSDMFFSSPSRTGGGHRRRGSEGGPPESVNVDDSRSYPSDSGYHSSGALSDGRGSSGNFEHGGGGYQHTMSSMRSVGSVGSHGSSDREHRPSLHHGYHRQFSWGNPPGRAMVASHIMNGETRFPTAMYASYPASEAAKSDIATVCSGSVVEDIDVSSVLSADLNVPQTPTERIVNNSSLRRSNSGGVNSQTTPRSVEFAPQKQPAAIPAVACMPPRQQQQQNAPPFPLVNATRASPPLQPTIALQLNDMGPPLSRTLLLQQQHHRGASGGGAASLGGSSRAGSVRSFGSHRSVASSDVVAHVDTDDCGGSLVESVDEAHCSHDEKEVREEDEGDDLPCSPTTTAAAAGAITEGEEVDAATNPLLQNGMTSSHVNGRTSPGGTVYKGRGVRRYQGRYMHLPLKRFHQNGVSMMACNEMMEEGTEDHTNNNSNGYHYSSRYDRSSSPRWGVDEGQHAAACRRSRSRSRSPPPPQDRRGHRNRSWSRSKSRSPTRTRKNGRSRRNRGWNDNGRHRSARGGERSFRSSGRAHRSNSRSESPSRRNHRHNCTRRKSGNWGGRNKVRY